MNTTQVPPQSLPTFTRLACGVPRTYAANDEQAEALEKLTGTKALSDAQLDALRALGFTVENVPDPAPDAFRSAGRKRKTGGE